jgi:hypothetical protein
MYDPATGFEVCQFVYVRIGCYPMALSGAVETRNIPADVGGCPMALCGTVDTRIEPPVGAS